MLASVAYPPAWPRMNESDSQEKRLSRLNREEGVLSHARRRRIPLGITEKRQSLESLRRSIKHLVR